MATRKIVILDRINEPSDYDFKYVFRVSSPSKINAYYKDKVSILLDATQEEKDEVASGAIVETSGIAHFKAGTDIAEVQATLEKLLAEYQGQINSKNPWKLNGSSFDGTSWIIGGIA